VTYPVYSTSFLQAQGLVGTEILGPVPEDEVWIVRDIDVYATGVLVPPFTYVFAHGANGQAFFYFQWLSGAQTWGSWRGRQAFEAGTTFDVETFNGPVDVTVSGYVLGAP
jgi:hypothetical protein